MTHPPRSSPRATAFRVVSEQLGGQACARRQTLLHGDLPRHGQTLQEPSVLWDASQPVQGVLGKTGSTSPLDPLSQGLPMSKERPSPNTFLTLGGRVQCVQCQATSKRTGQQCRAPAIQGQRVCRFHGGRSTGPKTPEGRQRCAKAKTVHGEETTAIRKDRSCASARLAMLESIGHALGIMNGATKTPGRKPGLTELTCPDLKQILGWLNARSP